MNFTTGLLPATGLTAIKNNVYLALQKSNPEMVKSMKGNDFEKMLVSSLLVTGFIGYVIIRSVIAIVAAI